MKRKAPGILPSKSWLQANGYNRLYQAMKAHPERFAHIQREHKRNTPGEWVSVAERLARKCGKLPSRGWLLANGYDGLYQAMWRTPKGLRTFNASVSTTHRTNGSPWPNAWHESTAGCPVLARSRLMATGGFTTP